MTKWNRHAFAHEVLQHPIVTRLRVDGLTLYIGKAAVGTVDTDPHWQMYKVEMQSDGSLQTYWADGDDFFDNVWSDWLGLSYS